VIAAAPGARAGGVSGNDLAITPCFRSTQVTPSHAEFRAAHAGESKHFPPQQQGRAD